MNVLVVNPGSTSTKLAFFEGEKELWLENLSYSKDRLKPFHHIADQLEMRLEDIKKLLSEKGLALTKEENAGKSAAPGSSALKIDAIAARGGLIMPIKGGTYLVDDSLLEELTNNTFSEHASNLGGQIAYRLGKELNVPAFVTDPVTVDEMHPEAKLCGIKGIERYPLWHALNQKAVVRALAEELGKKPEDLNVIVCHMGGGVSVGAHEGGVTVDVNNSLDGEGPMSAERSGTMQNIALLKMMQDENLGPKEIRDRLVGGGGFVSHLGTNDLREAKRMADEGDEYAALVIKTFIYQCSKEIAALSAVLYGRVDAIILTGGMAYSDFVCEGIKERVSFLAPVYIYPGEKEMEALALGALRVLSGDESARHFETSGKKYSIID